MASSLRGPVLPQEIPPPESLESPLPGGLASVVRFFLDFPQPLQVAGIVVGTVLVAVLALFVWRRRLPIWGWLRTRPRRVYAWAGALVLALALAAGVGGLWGWHYVQHDNGFCTGCHIMGPAFVRFTESEHSQLECHDCHQQPVSASMRQLYLWVVERPEQIGPHAPVPTDVCARCHIQDDPEDTWQAVSSTQGHRLHLQSDSSALAEVQCVTCHAREVHRFVPADETCGQSQCHRLEDTQIVLGQMSGGQTTFHCLGCHEFTAPVGEEGPPVERGAMMPALDDCGGCHAMEPLIAEFMPGFDPHEAVCGMCHNPHAQTSPAAAGETCTAAGCHADPESLTAFHRGLGPRVVEQCSTCHSAHGWIVDGDDCQACHTELRS